MKSMAQVLAPVLLCSGAIAGDLCVLVSQPARAIKLDGRDGSVIDPNFIDIDGLLGLGGAEREMHDGVWTQSGEIWISNFEDRRIDRFSGDGQAYLGPIATGYCRGLEVVGDQVWVVQINLRPAYHALMRYDVATLSPVATQPLWKHQEPWDLLLHQGDLLLSLNGYLFRHDATTGAFLGTFWSEGSGSVRQMDHLENGDLVLTRHTHYRLIYLSATGTYLGLEPYLSGAPQGIAVLDDGRYVVATSSATHVLDPVANTLHLVSTGPAYGVFEVPLPALGVPTCPGDGTAAPCPCANSGAAGRGCASSVNPAGARLAAEGRASLADDTVALSADGMPNSTALYFQGTVALGSGAGAAFGDGLRCAAGSVLRLGVALNAGGASQFPGPGGPSVSGQGAVGAPGSRVYQCWYRNAAAYCTSETFNLTNGLTIAWQS